MNFKIVVNRNTPFYLGFPLLVLKYAMALTNYPFNDTAGYIIVGVGITFFLIKIYLTNYTLGEGICFVVLLMTGLFVFIQSGDDALLISFIVGIAMKNTNLKTIFRIWTYLYIIISISIVLRSLGDSQTVFLIDRYSSIGIETMKRYSFGFSHPNSLQGTLFRIVCGILLLVDSNVILVLAEIANFFLFTFSKSRTGFISITVLILGFWILKKYRKVFSGKNTRRVTIIAEILIIFIDVFAVYTYGKYLFFVGLDVALTGRFSLAYRVKRLVPFSLFGCDIFDYGAPFAIDNGIWVVILSYGLVTFVGFVYVYLYALNKLNGEMNYKAIIIIITSTMYSICENTFGNFFISPALVIIFYMASNKWISDKSSLFVLQEGYGKNMVRVNEREKNGKTDFSVRA